VALSFINERLFLTVTQLVLPLHESTAEPLQTVIEFVANPAAVEAAANHAAVEPLYSTADPTSVGAALTKTFFLCVCV
jgi:hypothetical protein